MTEEQQPIEFSKEEFGRLSVLKEMFQTGKLTEQTQESKKQDFARWLYAHGLVGLGDDYPVVTNQNQAEPQFLIDRVENLIDTNLELSDGYKNLIILIQKDLEVNDINNIKDSLAKLRKEVEGRISIDPNHYDDRTKDDIIKGIHHFTAKRHTTKGELILVVDREGTNDKLLQGILSGQLFKGHLGEDKINFSLDSLGNFILSISMNEVNYFSCHIDDKTQKLDIDRHTAAIMLAQILGLYLGRQKIKA